MLKFYKRFCAAIALATAVVLAPTTAQAGVIEVFGDVNSMSDNTAPRNQLLTNLLGSGTSVLESKVPGGGIFPGAGTFSSFYGSLSGVSASLSAAPVTAGLLAGVDLLFINAGCCSGNLNPYSATEVSVMAAFLAGGGTIGLLAEPCCGGGLGNPEASSLNVLLAGLGTSIRVIDWEGGFPTTTMSSPLGAGVVGYSPNTFAYFSGGSAVATSNDTGNVMIAYENVGSAVPEPASLALMGVALACLGFGRRRKI